MRRRREMEEKTHCYVVKKSFELGLERNKTPCLLDSQKCSFQLQGLDTETDRWLVGL